MGRPESNTGISKLANVVSKRINKHTGDSSLVLDFGEILKDKSLLTNTFPVKIPKGQYSVCRQLTLGPTGNKLTETGKADTGKGRHGGHLGGDGSHEHNISIPEKMRSLKPGDRVLVAWVQSEAVVIDLIETS